MTRKPQRYVLVASPPTDSQKAHVARLEAEGFQVILLPADKPLDLPTAYRLAVEARLDQTRERLRPNPGAGRPTYPVAKE